MSFWTRLAATAGVMLALSLILDLAWRGLLGFGMPAYLAGVLGGLAAVPTWEYLKLRAAKSTTS